MEAVSGRPLTGYPDEHVSGPAGMDSTTRDTAGRRPDGLADGGSRRVLGVLRSPES